jgi:hypothetical protein
MHALGRELGGGGHVPKAAVKKNMKIPTKDVRINYKSNTRYDVPPYAPRSRHVLSGS